MTDLLLGIDVGSGSTKATLCRPDGSVVADGAREHQIDVPRPGWAEMDSAIWWSDLCALALDLTGKIPPGDRLAGVAVSAMGPCVLPVDASGTPLRPAILYGIDTRATAQIGELERRYGPEALFALNGNRLTSQSVGPKILWLREEEPDIYARARWFLTASAFLVMRLSGEVVIDRHGASHCNPLVDIATMQWSDRFADGLVELDRLPAIHSSEDLVGTVSAEAARQTGIPAGTPVTAGSMDTMAEAISVGVTDPGDLMVMYGSTAFLLLVLEARRSLPDVWTTAGCFHGRYGISGGMATAGALTTWFRNAFAMDLEATESAGGENAYEALADEAARSPAGSRGLVVLPYFSGERTPLHDPEARGVIAGLSLVHGRGEVYRALLEGTAYGIRHNLEVMQSTGSAIRRVAAVGGGAHNPLWLQIVSDVAGIQQEVPERTTGASFGDAFLVGRATGVIPSDDVLHDSWVRRARTVTPDPAAARAYEPYYEAFRALYPATREVVHRLAQLGEPAGS